MDGSFDEARGPGGGSRAKVGEDVIELGLTGICGSVGPDIESRLAIAAGAVGGDRSDRCVDARTARAGSSWGRIGSAC
jgi:hypothetical protein